MLQRSQDSTPDSALAGRSVLVTGHTGFKGSWLCMWLASLGARVTGYALAPPTEPNNFQLSNVSADLIGEYRGDIRDESLLDAALQETAPDVVIHLAAQTTVRESYRSPRETFDINVMGTAALLDAIRRHRRPCAVVLVSSDKCYENVEQVWGYRESDPLGGGDPYSASKGAMEVLVASYRRSFFPVSRLAEHGVQIATARAGNVLGGGDWTCDALLTDVMRAMRDDATVVLRQPRSVRPWQHVLEPLSGYLMLAAGMLNRHSSELCGPWNFGPLPGQELPVCELVDMMAKTWGRGQWKTGEEDHTQPEAQLLRLAVDKAVWQLGWRPRWTLAETVKRTVHWYRDFYDLDRSARELCLEHIAHFEATPSLGAEQNVHEPH